LAATKPDDVVFAARIRILVRLERQARKKTIQFDKMVWILGAH
jgi:hypothetical protein